MALSRHVMAAHRHGHSLGHGSPLRRTPRSRSHPRSCRGASGTRCPTGVSSSATAGSFTCIRRVRTSSLPLPSNLGVVAHTRSLTYLSSTVCAVVGTGPRCSEVLRTQISRWQQGGLRETKLHELLPANVPESAVESALDWIYVGILSSPKGGIAPVAPLPSATSSPLVPPRRPSAVTADPSDGIDLVTALNEMASPGSGRCAPLVARLHKVLVSPRLSSPIHLGVAVRAVAPVALHSARWMAVVRTGHAPRVTRSTCGSSRTCWISRV